MMKNGRIILALLSAVMMLLVAACGGGDSSAPPSSSSAPASTSKEAPKTEVKKEEKKEENKFPEKPVTIIVPYAAGGGTDLTARALAKEVEKHLGQSVAVVNKPGGTGSVGMTEGATAKPDGYTTTMVTVELTTTPHLGLTPLTYKDFRPVMQANFDSAAITVNADAPWNTIEEFIEYAKANPGKIRVGNSGPGGIWHLASAAFEKGTGVQFNHVPYDGAAPAITALLGSHIEAVSVSPAEVKAHVDAGKLKTLAVMSEERAAALPDVPTLNELGITGVISVGPWRGIAVPKDTPDDIVKVLEDAFQKGAKEPGFTDFMNKSGLGIVIKDGQGFLKVMEEGHNSFGELIPALGLK
jgi:tripartite-type tricarboxylate transporter receptor subunit TctC